MLTHRAIRYRIRPGTKGRARKLTVLAGACRWTWNRTLRDNAWRYQGWKAGIAPKPSVSFFSLGKGFTALRREAPWLQAYSCHIVRQTLDRQAKAWQAAFRGGGFPRYKSRHRTTPSFTIPAGCFVVTDTSLTIQKLGTVALHGRSPYPDANPVQVVCKQELGKWYAYICYAVVVADRVDNGLSVGVDRNAGQVTTSEPTRYETPNRQRLEARVRRWQRKVARQTTGSHRRAVTTHRLGKAHRHLRNRLQNWSHHVSKMLADRFSTIIVEALHTQGMTRKGAGTRKRGLNRVVRQTGWTQLHQHLSYKALHLVEVPAAYTSQQCSHCGHTAPENRPTQALFSCVRCGYTANADVNAAYNIKASGIGASARGGGDTCRPVKREMVRVLPTG